MRNEMRVLLRGIGMIVVGALLLILVLACSLFNQAPVAQIVANVLSGNSPLAVTFSATTSSDADGTIVAYAWDFGDDDAIDTGSDVQHTFTTTDAVKIFEITLTVTDDDGASSQATQTIEVHLNGNEPTGGTGMPTARFTSSKFIGVSPLTVTFDATTSTPGAGTIVAYNWNFVDGTQATGVKVTHEFIPDPEVTTTYPVTLFVWNSDNQVDTEQLEIIVIMPADNPDDEKPVADIFVTGPTMIYESTSRPTIASLFEVEFDPGGSYADAGHGLDYYAWDFGDGDLHVETSDLKVTHIYALTAPSQTLVARLTVFDDQGLEHTAVVNITLSQD